MKLKLFTVTLGILLIALKGYSQNTPNGLENIIVEKYYISTVADSIQADKEAIAHGKPVGALPVGSVTYRLYADMLPGWKLGRVYSYRFSNQFTSFETTTSFYNSPVRVGYPGEGTTKNEIHNNLLALNSYITGGAVAENYVGIPKEDDTTFDNNITTSDNPFNVLLGTNPAIGSPLTVKDGLTPGTTGHLTFYDDAVFDPDSTNTCICGNRFSITQGQYGPSGFSVAADSIANRVLIAQATTNGTFTYVLNMQLFKGNESQYFAAYPVNERSIPSLTNKHGIIPPTVHIIIPEDNSVLTANDPFEIYVTSNDSDGVVREIELFVDSVLQDTETVFPDAHSFPYSSPGGTHIIYAVATDNDGNKATSAPVHVTFVPKQNGLEKIEIEKYYVSTQADQIAADQESIAAGQSTGALPAGSVTYRIYADMLPGYKLSYVYGDPDNHPLLFSTTTKFYNNPAGALTPTNSKADIKNKLLALDSYVTINRVTPTDLGIPKNEDDLLNNNISATDNPSGVLLNNDVSTAIPLTLKDGMIAGTASQLQTYNIPPLSQTAFGNKTDENNFTIVDGSYFVANTNAPENGSNRVLIAQVTTDGELHYELNLRIQPPTGGEELYEARPTGNKRWIPSLRNFDNCNETPILKVAPAYGDNYQVGDHVVLDAESNSCADASSVDFYEDGKFIGTDNTTNPFEVFYFPKKGLHLITAKGHYANPTRDITSAPTYINVYDTIIPPVSDIKSPAYGSTFNAGDLVTINVDATDADGSVAFVEFFVDDISVGIDYTTPYSATYLATSGKHGLRAKATDNNGNSQLSGPGYIIVPSTGPNTYEIKSITGSCEESDFKMPIVAIDPVQNVIGYDIVLKYDKTKVKPTGNFTIGTDLISSGYASYISSVNDSTSTIKIVLYINQNTPDYTTFSGKGELGSVEFTKLNFSQNDVALFSTTSFRESYFTRNVEKPVHPGTYKQIRNTIFNGALKFWEDNSPIKYKFDEPAKYLVTNIYTSDTACTINSPAAQTDINGNFSLNADNKTSVLINRDIYQYTDVQPVINGLDASFAYKILIDDRSFIPTIYQAIALDVNMDGAITSGDLTQILRRGVGGQLEFKQKWNYNDDGTSKGQPSKDWVFVDKDLLIKPAYQKSATFPASDGVGYSKELIPTVPTCLPIPTSLYNDCVLYDSTTFTGILLGDIDGNYKTIDPDGKIKKTATSDDVVYLELDKAITNQNYLDIPVSFSASEKITSLDFKLKFNEQSLDYISVNPAAASITKSDAYVSPTDHALRYSCFSQTDDMKNYERVAYIRFTKKAATIPNTDFTDYAAYLNGQQVKMQLKSATTTAISDVVNGTTNVTVYPNPASNELHIISIEQATTELVDLQGRLITSTIVYANEKQTINTGNIASGTYLLKVYNNHFVSTQRIVINNNQ
jgi:hypothetical protein